MYFKRKVAFIISSAIIINCFSIFGIAIDKPKDTPSSSNTSIPIEEWHSNDEINDTFYNQIKELDESLNKPISQITDEDIKNFTGNLIIGENLTGIPKVINRFTNVSSIQIKNTNLFLNNIPETFFEESMPNLTRFVLSNDSSNPVNITELNDKFLQNAPKLTNIEIKNTNISSLPNNFLNNSNQLSNIEITNNNKLTSLPDTFLSNIAGPYQNILLNNNSLEKIPDNFLNSITGSINEINLSKNKLIKLPSNFLNNKNITINKIDISNNQIINLDPGYLNNATVTERYDSGNLFIPENDTNENNRNKYLVLSPQENISEKKFIFDLNKDIPQEYLHSILGNNPLIDLKTSDRSSIFKNHNIKFVSDDTSKSMFDNTGKPIQTGLAKGYIEIDGIDPSQNHLKTQIITVEIIETTSYDSTLKLLEIENSIISPTFDPDIISYNIFIPQGIESVNIKAIPTHENATISGDIGDVSIYEKNSLEIKVESENKRHQKTYTLNIITGNEFDSAPYLDNLDLGNGIALQNFSYNKTNYEIEVENDKTFVEISASTSAQNSIIKSNDINRKIHLNEGKNVFTIQVIAGNGVDYIVYTVIVNRKKSTEPIPVNEGYLSSLSINDHNLMPEFSPYIFDYKVNVPKSKDAVTINAETDQGTEISINSDKANTKEITLNKGNNIIEISTTTAKSFSRKYIINIYRNEFDDTINISNYYNPLIKSNNTSLEYLYISSNTGVLWSKPFKMGETNFEVIVPFETEKTDIIAIPSNSSSTISQSDIGTKALNIGNNEFTINVSNTNGISTQYTLNIIRKSQNKNVSSNNDLIYLNVENQNLIPTFDPKTNVYTLNVDNSVNTVNIEAIKYDYYSTISSSSKIGEQQLSEGENIFTITVIAEDQKIKIYTLKVNKAPSIDPEVELSSLEVKSNNGNNTHNLSPNFNKSITDYTLTVDNDTKEVDILATPKNNNSNVTGNGTTILNVGENKITITITDSTSSNTSNYNIIITRKPSNNTNLSSLSLSANSQNISINPKFDKDIYEYSAEVESSVDKININSTTENTGATILGKISNVELNKGKNKIFITVVAEDRISYKDIVLNITRKQSTTALLSSLSITDNNGMNVDLTPIFNKNTMSYTADVGSEASSIIIDALGYDNSVVNPDDIGIKDLDPNNNVYEINVTSEDSNTNNKYTITINKLKSNDNKLSSLSVTNNINSIEIPLDPYFNPNTFEYTVNAGEASEIEINATASSNNAKIEGLGIHTLNVGLNTIKIKVTAEDGSIKEYTLQITKVVSTNNNLSSLEIDNTTIPNFSSSTLEYNLEYPYETEKINITATVEDKTANVIGDGEHNLEFGENTFEIIVTAEDKSTKTYILKINRKKSNDDSLSDLKVIHNNTDLLLTPEFNSEIDSYTLNVNSDIDQVDVIATPNNKNAKVEGAGTKVLTVGSNQIQIKVTSQDGNKEKYYFIFITKASSSDSTLKSLSVFANGVSQNLSPTFSSNIKNYTLNVPNNIIAIEIFADKNHPDANILGIGNKTLNVGENVFEVIVTAADNSSTTYTLTVTRAASSDATLSSLKVTNTNNDTNLITNFNPGTYEYSVNVTNDITEVNIIAIAQDKNATITGETGIQVVNVGNNKFTIIVTAQDSTVQNYIINIIRASSNDATLSSLVVSNSGTDITLNPNFDPNTTTYSAIVDNNVTSVKIAATPNHRGANITGTGDKSINTGDNSFTITVTAEDGTTTKAYIIKITKSKSSDASLKSLKVSIAGQEQILNPAFNPSTTEYSLTVSNSITSINIDAVTNNKLASINGQTGNQNLNIGQNKFEITVTAEDGTTTKKYIINVKRLASDDATLNKLEVSINGVIQTLNPTFQSSITSYSLNVDNNITKATINAEKAHNSATISGPIGEQNLIPGANKFVIKVTAPDGISVLEYTLTIHRAPSTDASLNSLTVSNNGINLPLNPSFTTNTTEYTLTVGNNISNVDISAIANNSEARLSGQLGNINLNVGLNKITITVTAGDGSTVTNYNINITRIASNNSNLSSLEILVDGIAQPLTPNFNSATNSYTVTVREGVSSINIKASLEDNTATMSGDIGNKNIKVGSNSFTIVVTAQDSSNKTYNITVVRPVSSDATLSDISIVSSNKRLNLTPGFSISNKSYNLDVPNGISSVRINATPSFSGATVTGDIGVKGLNIGENIFKISVTAEDGITTEIYTITIKRLKSSDATLKNIFVSGISKNSNIFNLNPEFNSDIDRYSLFLSNSLIKVDIQANVSNPNATIRVSDLGIKDIIVGENIFEIMVTAEDGITTKTYYLHVNRSVPIKDIVINNLASSRKIDIGQDSEFSLPLSFNPIEGFDNLTITSSNEQIVTATLSNKTSKDTDISAIIKTHAEGTSTITISNIDNSINKSFDVSVSKLYNNISPGNNAFNPNNINSNEKNPLTSDLLMIPLTLFILTISSACLILFKRKSLIKKENEFLNRFF